MTTFKLAAVAATLALCADFTLARGDTNDAAALAGTVALAAASSPADSPKLVEMPSWGEKLKEAGATGMVQIGGCRFLAPALFLSACSGCAGNISPRRA